MIEGSLHELNPWQRMGVAATLVGAALCSAIVSEAVSVEIAAACERPAQVNWYNPVDWLAASLQSIVIANRCPEAQPPFSPGIPV